MQVGREELHVAQLLMSSAHGSDYPGGRGGTTHALRRGDGPRRVRRYKLTVPALLFAPRSAPLRAEQSLETGGTAMELTNIATMAAHDGVAWHVAWRPDGRFLASCGADRCVKIWSNVAGTAKWVCTAQLEQAHEARGAQRSLARRPRP